MKLNKYLKIAIVMLCILSIASLFVFDISADVGNSFSGGDYDGYDYGGSGYSDGGGGDLTFLIWLLFDHPIIAFVLIVGFVIYTIINNNRQNSTTHKVQKGHDRYSNPGFKSNSGIYEDIVVDRIKEEDPNFSKEEFKSYTNEVWLALQEAWEAKNWKVVRPFESNALFTVHERQLQEYIDNKTTNYMNKQNIRNTLISDYRIDGDFEKITVKLDASLLDFTLDDETMKLIEGSQDEFVHRSYRLEFIRTKQVTKRSEGSNVTNCPNCGAPTSVTSSGQCEYCKSVITNGDYGWVLNKYGPWN